ncbi:hypothetical protein BJ742DRAFT_250655 [Cladochytrium replicatum]|nr:hypothetical protein BJ742DRAFT_250655 [Cladochytrium replicatum]
MGGNNLELAENGGAQRPMSSAKRPENSQSTANFRVTVETTAAGPAPETFITQRAGKLIQVPVAKNESSSMFENKRTLQSTLLLQKKNEMQEVQALLEKKRLEFSKRMEECREKQEELRAKQRQLRDRVIKFEKFLKENDAKRQRANLKAQSERRLREQKEQEHLQLQKQLQAEQLKSENIQKMIKRYQVYEKYLQLVVDLLPAEYLDVNEPHINDILMRHKTLVETNEDLIVMLQTYQDEIESQQGKLAELVKEKNDLILVYNSTLGIQQKKLDKLKQDTAYMEQRLEERDNSGKERMRILGETKLAINNIYDRLGVGKSVTAGGTNMPLLPPVIGPNLSQGNDVLAGWRNALSVPQGGNDASAADKDNSKGLTEKLYAIQERVLDLQHVTAKVEQLSTQDKEKQKKLAATNAGVMNLIGGTPLGAPLHHGKPDGMEKGRMSRVGTTY